MTRGFTLFCLPHAGASAGVYRAWRSRLPRCIELVAFDLPGRGVRSAEPPLCDWSRLVDDVVTSVDRNRCGSFGLFGHSMGALVALEVAHALRERYGEGPAWLGVSACQAPLLRAPDLRWLTCGDEAVHAELRTLGAMPSELLENSELLDLLTPVLRADFHLCGSYSRPERAPLHCPMLVLGGTQDEISHPHENLTAWSVETAARCQVVMVDGGHFFVREQVDVTVRQVLASLSNAMRSIRPIPA